MLLHEKRLRYVGMTRAKERLYLAASRRRRQRRSE
ncbi:MAG TPA: 3'-5' exonuclease [Thermoanaerobaculia bacterium]